MVQNNLSETLVFTIYGDLGFFKKFYTTSSPLTFDFPPKTCLTGIIGALIGLSYSQRYELYDCKMALSITNPLKKRMFGINWLNTRWRGKGIPEKSQTWLETMGISPRGEIYAFTGLEWENQSPHTQAGLEILQFPKYKIYYPTSNLYADVLEDMLKSHKSFFHLYLGSSEFIADFNYLGKFKQIPILNPKDFVLINSIIYTDILNTSLSKNGIQIISNQKIIKDNVPSLMIPERKAINYQNVLYTLDSTPIKAHVKEYYKIENSTENRVENVVYF